MVGVPLELAMGLSRMTDRLEQFSDRLPLQRLPRSARSANEIGDDED